MDKKRLVVLCGHVGAGKSTLAQKFIEVHPDFVFCDIYNYKKKYIAADGSIKQYQTELSYNQFHSDLENIDQDVVVEIGIGHANPNLNLFSKLRAKYNIKLFFCILSEE